MSLFDSPISQTKIEDELIARFRAIKNMDFVKSSRIHNTGIGKTFEDLAGIKENNKAAPDYGHIEIKTYRDNSESCVTLFSKNPDQPKRVNSVLRERFGYKDVNFNIKVLHVPFFADKYYPIRSGYGFKLIPDDVDERLRISIQSLQTGQIDPLEIFFRYETIRKAVTVKTSHLLLVGATRRQGVNGEEFHFNRMKLLSGAGYDRFMELLREGTIQVEIRLGVYGSGKNIGKRHDHGSAFRIYKRDVPSFFKIVHEE